MWLNGWTENYVLQHEAGHALGLIHGNSVRDHCVHLRAACHGRGRSRAGGGVECGTHARAYEKEGSTSTCTHLRRLQQHRGRGPAGPPRQGPCWPTLCIRTASSNTTALLPLPPRLPIGAVACVPAAGWILAGQQLGWAGVDVWRARLCIFRWRNLLCAPSLRACHGRRHGGASNADMFVQQGGVSTWAPAHAAAGDKTSMMGGGTGCLGAYPQMKYLLPGMRPTTITAADLEPFKVHLLLSQKHSVCVCG